MSPITYSGASCSSAASRCVGRRLRHDSAKDLLDQQRMLGDREGVVADRLAVPAGDAREPVRDVGDLDVERRGVEQVEPAARQHALPGARRSAGLVGHQASSAAAASGKVKRASRRDRERQRHAASLDRHAGVDRFLDAVDAHDRQRRAVRRPCRACRSARPSASDLGAGRGQGAVGRGDQHAAARRAAVLHARHHFLADIAALPEADAAILVEQHVMREGVAQPHSRAPLSATPCAMRRACQSASDASSRRQRRAVVANDLRRSAESGAIASAR